MKHIVCNNYIRTVRRVYDMILKSETWRTQSATVKNFVFVQLLYNWQQSWTLSIADKTAMVDSEHELNKQNSTAMLKNRIQASEMLFYQHVCNIFSSKESRISRVWSVSCIILYNIINSVSCSAIFKWYKMQSQML